MTSIGIIVSINDKASAKRLHIAPPRYPSQIPRNAIADARAQMAAGGTSTGLTG
jgi:hypothetical protein